MPSGRQTQNSKKASASQKAAKKAARATKNQAAIDKKARQEEEKQAKLAQFLAENGFQVCADGKLTEIDDDEDDRTNSENAKKPASKALLAMEQQLAVVNKKAKVCTVNGEMIRLINDKAKEELWRFVKIISGKKAAIKATGKMLQLLQLAEYQGKGEDMDELRASWITAYKDEVVKAINGIRSYVQNRVKGACFDFMNNHNGQLPTQELLIKIVKRQIDLNDDHEVEVFKWYWDNLMAKAAGNMSDWHPDKRHFMLLSTAAPPNDPNNPYITPSTEAIALAMIESNRSRWTHIHAQAKNHPPGTTFKVREKLRYKDDAQTQLEDEVTDGTKPKEKWLNGPQYLARFTDSLGGQQEFSGWTKDGRVYFHDIRKMSIEARENRSDECEKQEQHILDDLRLDLSITEVTAELERAKNNKRKRKNKPDEPEDEEDGMDF